LNNFLESPFQVVSSSKIIFENSIDNWKELLFKNLVLVDKLKILFNIIIFFVYLITPLVLFFPVNFYIKRKILKYFLNILLFFLSFLWVLILGLVAGGSCSCF